MKQRLPHFWLGLLAIAATIGAANARADLTSEFPNVLVDARGSFHGFGDVVGPYRVATELVGRHGYQGNLTFLVDDRSLEILESITGEKVAAGGLLSNGIRIQTRESLALSGAKADLVLETFFANRRIPKLEREPFVTNKTVVLFEHDLHMRTDTIRSAPYGFARSGDVTWFHSSPGVKKGRTGILFDPTAAKLRGKTRVEIRSTALATVSASAQDAKRAALAAVLDQKALAGSRIGFAYGLHNERPAGQFKDYLVGVGRSLGRGQSAVVLTPNSLAKDLRKPLSEYPGLRERVVVVDPSRMPVEPVAGKVYVLETGKLSHDEFVGLLAFSDFPTLVEGDNATSAAIALGKPFANLASNWNYEVRSGLGERLLEAPGLDLAQKDAIRSIFLEKRDPDLTRILALESPAISGNFEKYSQEADFFTDDLVRMAEFIKKHSAESTATLARVAKDPVFRVSVLFDRMARLGDREALELLLTEVAKDPKTVLRSLDGILKSFQEAPPGDLAPFFDRLGELVKRSPSKFLGLPKNRILSDARLGPAYSSILSDPARFDSAAKDVNVRAGWVARFGSSPQEAEPATRAIRENFLGSSDLAAKQAILFEPGLWETVGGPNASEAFLSEQGPIAAFLKHHDIKSPAEEIKKLTRVFEHLEEAGERAAKVFDPALGEAIDEKLEAILKAIASRPARKDSEVLLSELERLIQRYPRALRPAAEKLALEIVLSNRGLGNPVHPRGLFRRGLSAESREWVVKWLEGLRTLDGGPEATTRASANALSIALSLERNPELEGPLVELLRSNPALKSAFVRDYETRRTISGEQRAVEILLKKAEGPVDACGFRERLLRLLRK